MGLFPDTRALEIGCVNAKHPDLYGHYRESKFTQTKHHWWWKANRVFDQLSITRNHSGMVLFLEEDHYVAEDFLHVLRLMERTCKHSCERCNVLSLGTYLKTYNYFADFSRKVRVPDSRFSLPTPAISALICFHAHQLSFLSRTALARPHLVSTRRGYVSPVLISDSHCISPRKRIRIGTRLPLSASITLLVTAAEREPRATSDLRRGGRVETLCIHDLDRNRVCLLPVGAYRLYRSSSISV